MAAAEVSGSASERSPATSYFSRRCAVTYASDQYDLEPYYSNGILMILWVGNDSNRRHTINGYAAGYNLSAYD
jgi:hypothetical protein